MNANPYHPLPEELASYAARRLSATDVLRVSDHLAGCAACRETFAQIRTTPPMRSLGEFLAEDTGEIPGFDELAGEVDGTGAPATHEEFAAQLRRSPAAREALADLAAFRAELASLPTKVHHAANALTPRPAAAAANNVVVPPLWRWRKVAAWSASVAALLVAVALGSWVFTPAGGGTNKLLRDADGRLAELGGLPVELRASVETAARTGQLPPLPATPATDREIIAGHADKVRMTTVSPVGVVVREQQPSLQWTPREEATGYQVSIAPTDGGALITSPLLPAGQTHWAPPEALPRAKTYQWQVEALHGEAVIDRAPKPPLGEARFQILDVATDRELDEVEKRDAGFPLVLGVAYWRAGLAADAAIQFHRLADAHAESVVVRRLMHDADSSVGPVAPANSPAKR